MSASWCRPTNRNRSSANQDTLYSAVVLDLAEPATITLPEVGDRFQSMLVINQDHFSFVESSPGTYELTEDEVGTRFAFVLFRTFVDAADPHDLASAHATQDGIALSGGGDGPFEAPDWDLESLAEARKVADDVWSRLDGASMTFEEAASLFSEDARSKFKKGEWDSFTPAQLDEVEGGASILELKVGEFSKPLLYAGGYRIVKLEQKLPVPPLSPKIAAALRKSQASALFAEAWKKSRRGYDLERLLPAGEDR